MSAAIVFGLCAAVAVGLGLYGVITNPQPLRKILAFNLIGSGVFTFFGVVAHRGAAAGFGRWRCARAEPSGGGGEKVGGAVERRCAGVERHGVAGGGRGELDWWS